MKRILISLLLSAAITQSYACSSETAPSLKRCYFYQQIEKIVPSYNPAEVTLHILELDKILLQEITNDPSKEVPRERLQKFLRESHIDCIAEFRIIKYDLDTGVPGDVDRRHVERFIDTHKLPMRELKHFGGIDLIKQINESLALRHDTFSSAEVRS